VDKKPKNAQIELPRAWARAGIAVSERDPEKLRKAFFAIRHYNQLLTTQMSQELIPMHEGDFVPSDDHEEIIESH